MKDVANSDLLEVDVDRSYADDIGDAESETDDASDDADETTWEDES